MAFAMPVPNTAPTQFTGTLTRNEVFGSIYNMIISQEVFASPIKGTYSTLADKFRKEGSEYGDSKLFYSVQIGDVEDWRGDAEAADLLELNRPEDPACQVVKLDTFKLIWLTVDRFLSKRAWGNEGIFSQFTSVVLATMRDAKRVYEAKMVNAFVGSTSTAIGRQTQTVALATGTTEADHRLRAQQIGRKIADILVDIKDPGKSYNDYQYERSYDEGDLMFVWNADFYNEITKLDLPTIFHNDGIVERLGENVLPARYFGDTITTANLASYSAASPAPGKPINSSTGAYTPGAGNVNGTIRSLYEMDLKVGGTTTHVRPGDEIPSGFILKDATIVGDGTVASLKGLNLFYIENRKAICKIMHKDAIQYMSGFNSETEFINSRAKTETHYLIFGYSSLPQARLKEYPYITLLEA